MSSRTKNRIRPGNILVSDSERAIVIEYEQETFELNEDGSTGQSLGKSQGTKKLKVKSLSAETNIDTLATEMMEKCKLIKPSALSLLRAALEKLQLREVGTPAADVPESHKSSIAITEKRPGNDSSASAGKVLCTKANSGEDVQVEHTKSKKSRREKISSAFSFILKERVPWNV